MALIRQRVIHWILLIFQSIMSNTKTKTDSNVWKYPSSTVHPLYTVIYTRDLLILSVTRVGKLLCVDAHAWHACTQAGLHLDKGMVQHVLDEDKAVHKIF